MDDFLELKHNLINRFEVLKNRYPDCLWLQECMDMNKRVFLMPEMKPLQDNNRGYRIFFSEN